VPKTSLIDKIGNFQALAWLHSQAIKELFMNGIIYLVGLVVVVLFVLSFLGLR
jgi:hypothetical protein